MQSDNQAWLHYKKKKKKKKNDYITKFFRYCFTFEDKKFNILKFILMASKIFKWKIYIFNLKIKVATLKCLLCISTSFWMLCVPESWSKYIILDIFNQNTDFFRHFFLDFRQKSLKILKMNKKKLKTAQKSISTSFQVHAEPNC